MFELDALSFENNFNDECLNIKEISQKDIAIIGISIRTSKANNKEEFFQNLCNGIECIGEMPLNRRKDIAEYEYYKNKKRVDISYEKNSYLNEIDCFDNNYFKISNREAALMDPNQRIFLQECIKAIEDAGYGGDLLVGSKTGVYAGFGTFGGSYQNVISDMNPSDISISFAGNLPSILASNIAYQLDFKGPSMVIDTACSSSLVAVHLASQAIRNGECEQALAGGIKLMMLPIKGENKLGVESSDGKTRTFDDESDGTGGGEGVAVVLLKSLNKAIKDNDNIYAVIRGSAINQDGRTMGITAPNPKAQEEVILQAWEDAGVNPESISYIECHGTGTKLGDPIEIEGIDNAFRHFTNRRQFCGVGSIKTNLGHLDYAAGIVGLIKAALSLKYKKIPPSLNFNRPNRKIPFYKSSVYVNDILKEWETNDEKRRCGISAFGMSGTNCNIILEEAPEIDKYEIENKKSIFTISAKSKKSLELLILDYIRYFSNEEENIVRDICYTTNIGRGHYEYRLAIAINSLNELKEKLKEIKINGLEDVSNENIYYGIHKDCFEVKEFKEEYEISSEEKEKYSNIANGLISRYVNNEINEENFIKKICEKYIKGANIKWNKLYLKEKRRKISLPTYKFEKTRCWIENSSDNFLRESGYYYITKWNNVELSQQKIKENKDEFTIIFRDKINYNINLLQDIKNNIYNVVEVIYSKSNEDNKDNIYFVDNGEEIYNNFFLNFKDKNIKRIIHMTGISNEIETLFNDIELEDSQQKGIYNLLNITKGILSNDIKNEIDIILITQNLYDVVGNENIINPNLATMVGLAKSISMENINLKCRNIDIDINTNKNKIIEEIKSEYSQFKVAYRNNMRYTENLLPTNILDYEKNRIEIKDTGVYVITGGIGCIGISISNYLIEKNKNIDIAMINRSKLPPRFEWKSYIRKNEDIAVTRKIKAIINLEQKGAKVHCYSADISNEAELSSILCELKNKFERINGVIHSAGISSTGKKVNDENVAYMREALLAKVYGTWNLHKLTINEKLDFFIIFSSPITLMSGIGEGSYTASNTYLESFASYRNKIGKKTLCIEWAPWEHTVAKLNKKIDQNRQLFKSLSILEALCGFDEVLNRSINQIFLGRINFESNLFYLKDRLLFNIDPNIKSYIEKILNISENIDNMNSKIVLNGKNNDQEYTENEIKIANAWAEVLGKQELSIYDNFFELGGHSVLAIKLESVLDKKGIQISYKKIYEYSTILKLAEYVDSITDKENIFIIDNIEPFNVIFFKSCFYNSYFPIIEKHQKSIVPYLVNDTIAYNKVIDKQGSSLKIDYLSLKNIQDIASNQGIGLIYKENNLDLFNNIIKAISEKRPVIIWSDCFYEECREDTYLKIHYPHTLLIYGYNQKEKYFNIIEHEDKDSLSYHHTKISYESTKRAFDGYIDMFQESLKIPAYLEVALSENDNIENADTNYISIMFDGINFYKENLVDGIKYLNEFIDDFNKKCTEEKDLNKYLTSVFETLNNIVNAKKVEVYKLQLIYKESNSFIDLANKILELWQYVRGVLGKILFSEMMQLKNIDKIKESLVKILELENKYINQMLKNNK